VYKEEQYTKYYIIIVEMPAVNDDATQNKMTAGTARTHKKVRNIFEKSGKT
jgi:hypothetical protein